MRPFRTASAVFALPVLSGLLAACAGTPSTVAVPDAIKGAADEKVVLVVPATGAQIYECRAKANQTGAFEWAFVAPDADLFDTNGMKIGKHYAGPAWESNDGSKITGAVKARADAPAANAIPWLLLTATASGAKGGFSDITAVQRVNTVGGVAPTAACAQANAGMQARVPYTADYYLLAKR